jgi:hypothetical protein
MRHSNQTLNYSADTLAQADIEDVSLPKIDVESRLISQLIGESKLLSVNESEIFEGAREIGTNKELYVGIQLDTSSELSEIPSIHIASKSKSLLCLPTIISDENSYLSSINESFWHGILVMHNLANELPEVVKRARLQRMLASDFICMGSLSVSAVTDNSCYLLNKNGDIGIDTAILTGSLVSLSGLVAAVRSYKQSKQTRLELDKVIISEHMSDSASDLAISHPVLSIIQA